MGKALYAISETTSGVRTTKNYMLHAFTSYDEFIKYVEHEEKCRIEAKMLQGFDMEIKWSVITNDIENGEYPKILTDLIKKFTTSKKISRFIEGKEELIKVGHKSLYIGSVSDVKKEVKE